MPDAIPRGRIWTLISVDVFARISYGLARTPILPLYAAFLGAGPAMVGFVGAAATITGIVLKLPSGAVSDIVGKRPLLLAGLFVFATGPALYLFAGGTLSLAGIRFYHGLATAIYSPVAMAAVAALAAERRGEYLSWLSNSKIAGKLLGAFLGGLVLSWAVVRPASLQEFFSVATLRAALSADFPTADRFARGDFTRAYFVCLGFGAAALVLGLLVLGRIGDAPVKERRSLPQLWRKFRSGIAEVVSEARVLLSAGSEGVQNLTVGIVEQFLPIYAVFVAGCSPLEAGLLYGGQILTTIVSKPLFGRFSDRHGRRGLILAGMLLCAAPFAAIPWVTSFSVLFGLCLVFGLGEALVTSSSAAFVGDLCKARSMGAAMGVFGTIQDTGHALGPILGGVLISLFAGGGAVASQGAAAPYRITFAIVAGLLLVYSVVFASVVPREVSAPPGTNGGKG